MDEQHNPLKSELKFLERLSIEELEALLKLSGDPDDVELLFDTVVEEVVAREKENPTGRLPDVDAAWDELQMMYQNMPVEERRPPPLSEGISSAGDHGSTSLASTAEDKPRRVSFRKVARTAAIMAAAVVLCLVLMVGAQAAGVDVFGALARWTDDTFHFETWSAESDNNSKLYSTIQKSLNMQKSFEQYAPRWYPEGSTIKDVQISQDDLGVSVLISLTDGEGNLFYINIDQYNQHNDIDLQTFEIDADSVEKYTCKGRIFYIFSNAESNAAVWSDGVVLQAIWGELDTSSLKFIIDSIGD